MNRTITSIMLVDDNKIDNFFHERVIKKYNPAIQVIAIPTGRAALDYLENKITPRPEIIFLDINMPGMNGWQFLERYSKLPAEHKVNLVVVMLTTSENPDDRAKALSHGILTDFRSKPLTVAMLEEVVAHYNEVYLEP